MISEPNLRNYFISLELLYAQTPIQLLSQFLIKSLIIRTIIPEGLLTQRTGINTRQ